LSKLTIMFFWVGGLVFTIVGVILALQIPPQELQAPASIQSPVMIPGALIIVASVASSIAWIGALVLAARIGAWGWFVGILLLGTLGLLIFLIFGPDLAPAGGYDDYDLSGDYGAPV